MTDSAAGPCDHSGPLLASNPPKCSKCGMVVIRYKVPFAEHPMTDELSELRKRVETLERRNGSLYKRTTELERQLAEWNQANGNMWVRLNTLDEQMRGLLQSDKPAEPQPTICPGALVNEGCNLNLAGDPKLYVTKPAESGRVGEDVETLARIIATSHIDLTNGGFSALAQHIIAKIKAGEVPGICTDEQAIVMAQRQADGVSKDLRKQLEVCEGRRKYADERWSYHMTEAGNMGQRITELEEEVAALSLGEGPAGDELIGELKRQLSEANNKIDFLTKDRERRMDTGNNLAAQVMDLTADRDTWKSSMQTECSRANSNMERIRDLEKQLKLAMEFHACYQPSVGDGLDVSPGIYAGDLEAKWLAARQT